MKTGTVKWFNPQKGHGFIRPDDGSPNILVHLSAVYSAGMGCLEVGQRVIFEIEQNERTGSIFAAALTPLEFESFREDRLSPKNHQTVTTPPLDGRFTTTNPFDILAASISTALGMRSRH
jgi:CspA family cold shock protein